ncbi:MAG: hypothetical protein HY521_05985 [Proteobacteria bacterium]|nr:hypothetical protein [Pseudomonadota bacterium]
MARGGTIEDFHRRLDTLEARMDEAFARIGTDGKLHARHAERIHHLDGRRRAMRQRLEAAGAEAEPHSSWEAMMAEVERDFDDLVHAFEHWAAHVDRDFRRH